MLSPLDLRRTHGERGHILGLKLLIAFFYFLAPISNLCLKDLSQAVTAELVCRLRVDPIALQRFYQSFGLDPEKLFPESLQEFFPDTPAKLLRDVFEELQLYDLVELLEKVKPHTLRPVLPLKEIRKVLNATNRPTKMYSKADVLVIQFSESTNAAVDSDNVEKIKSFFKALNSQSHITTVSARDLAESAGTLKETKRMVQSDDWRELRKECMMELLCFGPFERKELDNVKKQREQWTREIKPKIEKDMEQRQEKLQEEYEKFQMAVSDVMDKWICQVNDEG